MNRFLYEAGMVWRWLFASASFMIGLTGCAPAPVKPLPDLLPEERVHSNPPESAPGFSQEEAAVFEKHLADTLIESWGNQGKTAALSAWLESRVLRAPERFLLAECLAALGRRSAAASQYGALTATAQDGEVPIAHASEYRLGEMYFAAGQYDAAQSIWERVRANSARTYLEPEANFGLALVALAQGRSAEAVAALRNFSTRYPAYQALPELAQAWSLAELYTGEHREPLRRLQADFSAWGVYLKARHLFAAERYLESAKYLKLFLAGPGISPMLNHTAAFLLGEDFFQARDYAAAERAYASFLERYALPDSPLPALAEVKLLAVYALSKNTDKLKQMLDRAGQSESQTPPLVRFAAGEYYREQGDLERALTCFASIPFPEGGEEFRRQVALRRGWCAWQLGQPEAARLAWAEWLRLSGEDPLIPWVVYLLRDLPTAAAGTTSAASAVSEDYSDLLAHLPYTDFSEQLLVQIQDQALVDHDDQALVRISESFVNRWRSAGPIKNRPLHARILYTLAEAAWRLKDSDKALRTMQVVLDDFWDTETYWYAKLARAGILFSRNQWDQARDACQQLLLKKNLNIELQMGTRLLLGLCEFNQKNYKAAAPHFLAWQNLALNAGTDISQASWVALLAGESYSQMQNYRQAIEQWEKNASAKGGDPAVEKSLMKLADLYFGAAEYEKSLRWYRDLLRRFPESTARERATFQIAHIQYELKQYADALSSYAAYASAFPAGKYLAQVQQEQQTAAYKTIAKQPTREALAEFLAQYQNGPYEINVLFMIMESYFESGEYAAALDQAVLIQKKFPTHDLVPSALFWQGQILERMQQGEPALAVYGGVIARYRKHALVSQALLRRGVIFQQAKKFPEALAEVARLIAEYPNDAFAPQALLIRALLFSELQREQDMIADLETLAEKHASSPEARKARVWAGKWAHEKKRYALAIRMLAPILAEANATPEMAYRLGDAYQNLGNTAAAKRCYQRAAVLNPKRDLFRIVAMTQLAALYEGAQEFRAALDAYREIVKAAANKQLLEAARQRILLLEKYLK